MRYRVGVVAAGRRRPPGAPCGEIDGDVSIDPRQCPPTTTRRDDTVAKAATQARHVCLQRLGGRARRGVAPEQFDQRLGADHFVGVQAEQGEYRPGFGADERDRTITGDSLGATKNSNVHRAEANDLYRPLLGAEIALNPHGHASHMDTKARAIARRFPVILAAVLVGVGTLPVKAAVADVGASPVRVRKNVAALSAQERRDFVAAVLKLKTVPSPYDSHLSYYDQFVLWHISLYPCGMDHPMMGAHGGPMFLPWHRLFLLRFEKALREVSGKPITVPYWDWTDPASTASVFANDFMGGDGNPDDEYAVTTGPFRKGQWALHVHPVGAEWSASVTTHLTRRFGSLPIMPTLPQPEDVAFVLQRPAYDVAPYDGGSNVNTSFRNALEGFWRRVGPARITTGSASMVCGPDGMVTTSGEGMHNRVHGWVGGLLGATTKGPKFGTMFLPSSPNDPVFFLHHANIDRLWAEWQGTHGVHTYEPRARAVRISWNAAALLTPRPTGCTLRSMRRRMTSPTSAPSDTATTRRRRGAARVHAPVRSTSPSSTRARSSSAASSSVPDTRNVSNKLSNE